LVQTASQHSLYKTHQSRWQFALSPLLLVAAFIVTCFFTADCQAKIGDKKPKEQFGLGFTAEVSASLPELTQAVQDVAADGIIQGTKEYDKDPYVSGASVADNSPLFPKWDGAGNVYFKVRTNVLAPRNFEASADQGTLAVRYVVRPKDATRSILRIDAVYVENERRTVHLSNGTVEASEFRDIQDHVDAIQLKKKQAIEGEKTREEEIAHRAMERDQQIEAENVAVAESSSQGLEQRIQTLRQQLERSVKGSGVQLKSAPYKTAAGLKALDAGTQVVILIVTPYWYGVETEDGLHGWLHRDQLGPIQ
jgi:hypothetical protein